MSRLARSIARSLGIDPETIMHCANPNRMGEVVMYKDTAPSGTVTYCVMSRYEENDGYGEPDGTSEWSGGGSLTEEGAKEEYDARVRELQDTPNWAAQAEYDDAHGTINGEDPGIVQMRELWGE